MVESRTSRTGEEGFTLIEVIVAVTILGISLAAILGVFSQALTRAHARDRAFAARVFAQDVLARATVTGTSDSDNREGRTDDGLSWILRIAPYGKADVHAPHMAIMTATVSWPGEAKTQSISLTTLELEGSQP